MVDGGWRPGPPAAAREPRAEVQPPQDLAQGQTLIGKPAIKQAHQFGLRLIDDELTGGAVMARQVAIAVGRAGTDELPSPRLLELTAPEAFTEQRSLVLGDGALDLKQELVARIVGDRAVEELDRALHPAELLQQEHLVGVAPGQPVRGENGNDIDFPVAHRIAQGVQARPVEARPAVSLIAEHMGVGQLVVRGVGPGAEDVELAVDGLLAFLALSGDTGIDGGAHGAPPSMIESGLSEPSPGGSG